MDYTIKHNGFWFQHFILFVCVLFISGMKRSGVRLYNETGIITSPGYPNDYPNSVAVIWLINTTQSKYIELTFVDFDVEPYSDCAADYVKIRNKKASSWSFKDVPQIDLTTKESTTKISTKGPYCNSNRPPKIITSSSNLMAIVFIADSSESHRGFKATYRSIEKKACNIIKTESSGTIITPGYPLRYPNEGECYWTISVLPGKFIRLEFIEFDLEFNTQLCMDEIYIWDGAGSSAPLLARGCRLNPKVVYSSSNHMRIKFTSQGYHRNKGFKAIYTTSSSKGCGGDFSSTNGTFDSPSFDLLASYTYPAYSDCLWTISAPVGNVISLKLSFFDVLTGASGHCDEDYVDVFDGSVQGQMSRIGRYCNSKKPSVVVSSSNLLQIRFISNHKGHGKGFRVKFQRHSTACDQPLGIEDGRISDNRISASSYLKQNSFFKPSFARLNGLYAWCSQVQINNRVGEYLQIDFKEYNKITGFATQGYTIDGQKYFIKKYKIEYSNNGGLFFTGYKDPTDNSRSDYTIFQGNNEIKRNHLKHPVVTKMFRIYPLGYVHGKRRVICMRAELYGCKFNFGDGKLLQNPDDNILHNAASNTKSSHWVISPSNMYGNSVVYIMPLFFNIDCKKSTLRISDGVTNKSYCDKNQPPPFQVFSAKGQIFVSLETKEGQNAVQQRFGLQYFTENLGSGRIMRSRRGIVRSPRHVPERVSNQTASTWIIVQPNKERIVARFTTLRLGKSHHGKCDEYVEIKDGLLGGIYSQLGANESRLNDESMKVACTYFQCSAGAYQYLRDNFNLDSFPDMLGDILQLKAVIMLGQAQECLLEKSVRDNRKNTLIARIAMQIKDYFQEAVNLLQGEGTSEMGSSLRKIYMSNEADQDKKFGDKVSYLKAASSKMNEAMKLSKNQPEQVLENLKFLNDVVGNKLEAAVKENDFVYHASVPEIDKMPEIKGVCLVKAMQFQYDDPSVSGPDIFQRLIPMRAHEASSLYSEEKASVLREITKKIEEKDLHLSESLSSMDIDDLLNPVDESLPDNLLEIRKKFMEHNDVVATAAGQLKELAAFNEEFDNILNDISAKINEEEQFEKQAKVIDSDSGLSSELENLKKEFTECKDVNQKARETNALLSAHFNDSKGITEFLIGPEEKLMSSLPSQNVIQSSTDEPVVQRMRELLAAIDKMKSQRKQLEQQFREQIRKDDITSLLVIKDDRNREEFFKEQLKKHDELKAVIEQNLNAQDGILTSLTEANAKYAPTRMAAFEIKSQRDDQVKSYLDHAKLFEQVKEMLERGVPFHKNLKETFTKLLKKVDEYSQKREKEKKKFAELKKREGPPSRPVAAKPTFDRASKPAAMQSGPPQSVPGSMYGPQIPDDVRRMPPGVPGDAMHIPRSNPGLNLPPGSQPIRPMGQDGAIMQPRMPNSFQPEMQPRFIPQSTIPPRFTQSDQAEMGQLPPCTMQPRYRPPGIIPTGQDLTMHGPIPGTTGISQPSISNYQLPQVPPQGQRFPVDKLPPNTDFQNQGFRIQDSVPTQRFVNQIKRTMLIDQNQRRFGAEQPIRPTLPQNFEQPIRPVLPHVEQPVRPLSAQYRDQSARQALPQQVDPSIRPALPQQVDHIRPALPQHVDHIRPAFPQHAEQAVRPGQVLGQHIDKPFRPGSPQHVRPPVLQQDPNIPQYSMPRPLNPIQPQASMQFRPQHDRSAPHGEQRMPFTSPAMVSGVSLPPLNAPSEHVRFSSYGNVMRQADYTLKPQGQVRDPQFHPVQNQPRQQIMQPQTSLTGQYSPRSVQNIPSRLNMPPQQQMTNLETRQPAQGYVRQDLAPGAMLARQDSGSRPEVLQPRFNPAGNQAVPFNPATGQFPPRQFSSQEQYRHPTLPEPLQPQLRLPEPLMPSKIGQDLVDTREQSSDPRMPGVLREPDRSLMQNVSPGPLGNQMFPEGQERKPDPIHPGQQLVQPLQPTPLGDSTFRQEPFVRDNESSMQQLRYSADLTGAPQARQPQNQIPDEIRGQPNIAPRGTVSQYVTMQSNTVQNNQYAFQGPISTSRPASMGGDVSIVSTMNLERSYETPSAPPQQVSMPSPGVRNYPPFSPTQVFDPITMNNRPVMAATRSADSVLSGILGNAGSVQGVKANQSDAMQLGMQQFQIQQLFMQQQQLISMIQNQQNQQKQTESLQIEKLQNQLVDQQRYIIQLANEQQKLQHKQESATEDYSHLLIAQFEQKINEQSKQLLEQQKELQQLQVKNIKTPLVISSNDPPVIKSSSADVDTSGNQKLAAEVISESAYPSMLTSLDLSEKSSARENKEQSNIDLKLAGLIVTCTDTPSGDQISISSEKPDTVRHTEDSKCSPLVVKPETLSDSFSDDKKPSEVTSGEKEQLKADLDQFEQEMDAVLSGAVSNTLTTPTSKESNVHSSMEKASGDEAILKDLLVGPTERQVKAGGNASQEGGGTEDVFVTKNEDAVPFYEPMLDKEQSVRSRQITSSNSSKSDSSIPLNEDNVSQEKDTLNKEHKEESKSGELNLGEDIIKDKSMAEDSSTVTSELVDAISEESLPKNTEDSFESAVKTSTESTLNALTGLDALKLPEHPTILPTVDTNEKIDSAENEIKLDTTKSTDVPSASCKGDLGGSSSPISITVDSNTLSPELGVSPPRPHLNRQQGRLSFLQTQEEDDVRKAYLEDLDAAVDRLHEQCMELCKKQRGVPVDGFTQMWNDLAQVEELDSCSFTTNAGIQNANKNRYRDILPYDHTRVLLKSLPNDYINASHISKLTPLSPHYIASQGPIPQCFEDFWTMVWEQDCSVIVMLTNEVEGSKLKCHPYWPRKLEQTAEYGHMAVYLMEQEAGPSWKSRKFLVTNLKVNDSRMVTQLQFTAWPDYGIPNTPYDLLSFFEEVHRCYSTLNAKAKNPLLLHCSAGVGRTGTFSCIYSAIEEINGGNGLVEVPGLVRKLRQCRFHMVQRKEQLVFCYQAILCYAQQYLAEEQMKEDSKNSRSVSVSQLEDEVMVQLNQAEKEASAEEFHQHVENIPADIVKYDSKGETRIEKSTEDQLLKIDLSTKTLDTSSISDSGHPSGGTGAILQKSDATLVGDYKSAAANPDEMKSSHEEPHHSRDRADSIPKFKVRSDIFSSRSPPPSPGVPNIPSDNDSDHT